MLSVVVVAAIAAFVFLDMMRRLILTRVAVETESRLGAPVLSAAAKSAQSGASSIIRITGPVMKARSCCRSPSA
jgi:ATP-binding cassette subfamily C protein